MLKNLLRSAAVAFVLAAALISLAPRPLQAKVFCITECNDHEQQLCCGDCSPRSGCQLICHPPSGTC